MRSLVVFEADGGRNGRSLVVFEADLALIGPDVGSIAVGGAGGEAELRHVDVVQTRGAGSRSNPL